MRGGIVLFLSLTIISGLAFGENGPEFFIKEGNDLFSKMNYDKAVVEYGKGIEAFPDEPVLYYDRGNAYQKKGELDKAISDYLSAEKKNPKKILLKNLYFNLGNAYYARAEKLKSSSKDQMETLKEALLGYEKASDAYRKSISIEREFAVQSNRDFSKVGAYTQKNMALTKEAWTQTWEQIKLLERKNMKLEDGIERLLNTQSDLLPNLEKIYIHSMNEEILNFGLKTLSQYHVDCREDLASLRELADKEIERADAELENQKKTAKAKPQAPPSAAGPGAATKASDDELISLEDNLNTAKEIKKVIDQVTGLSEWVVDGLNTKKPLEAWKNNYYMIILLKNLSDYLKKQDPVLTIYPSIMKEIMEAEALLGVLKQPEDIPKEEGKDFDSAGLRMKKLAKEKIDATDHGFRSITNRIEEIIKKMGEFDGSAKDKKEIPDQNKADDPYVAFLRTFDKKASPYLLNRAKEMNSSCEAGLKEVSSTMVQEEGPDMNRLNDILNDTATAFNFYKNFQRPFIEIMVEVYHKIKDLKHPKEKGTPEGVIGLLPYDLLEVLIFKYQFLLSDDLKDMVNDSLIEREALEKNYLALQGSHQALRNRAKMIRDSHSAVREDAFLEEIKNVEEELLKGICLMAPEVASALFFDAFSGDMETLLANLPGSKEKIPAILEASEPLQKDLTALKKILSDYFKVLSINVDKKSDGEAKESLKKKLAHRKMALSYLERGLDQYVQMKEAYSSEKFLSGDFIAKDLKNTLEKSRLIFSNKPDDASQALKLAISYQTKLRESSQEVIDMTAKGGSAAAIASYLTDNQKDIQMFSGIAAMKIRELGEKEEGTGSMKPGPGVQQGPPGQTPRNKGLDPGQLEEAINLVQDAMVFEEKIRAFLEAMEYHNTLDKHPLVIEKLEKALAILDRKEEKKEKEPEKNKSKGEDNKAKQNQNGNQDHQEGQGQKESKPLELSPDQARELLNELNRNDQRKSAKETDKGSVLNVPRPW